MSVAFALLTSDANLLPCELGRLKGRVGLDGQSASHLAGVGWYAQEGNVLLRRFPLDAAPKDTTELVAGPGSEALLYLCAPVDVSQPVENLAQPFRFRGWLFAHAGSVPDFGTLRPRLLAALPEFLRRQLRSDSVSEVAFALFLKLLREAGRTDDRDLDAALAAQLLSRTVRTIQQLSIEAGASRPASLNLFATNDRISLATRSGEEPVYYALLEGSATCERCKLDPARPETEPAIRAHRRRRTVVIASHPLDPSSWIELPPGFALAVDPGLNVQRLPL